jgi:mono/diheme cytochrome c family protein
MKSGLLTLAVFVSAVVLLPLLAQETPQPQPRPQTQQTTPPAAPNAQQPRRSRMGDFAAAVFTPGAPPDPAAVARGQQLFVPTCGFCHGPDASGRSGPDLVQSSIVIADNNGNLLGPMVRNGRPGKGMPAFASLTDAQIWDLSAFLHSRVRAAANRFTYNFAEVVTGSPQAGQAYFDGAGKCNTCHSPAGDLAGIARRYQPANLQARMLYPGRSFFEPGQAPPPTRVTVTMPSGQTFSGVLISRDPFNVALREDSGWYHSLPVQGAKVQVEDPLAAHQRLIHTITDPEMHDLLAYLETLK